MLNFQQLVGFIQLVAQTIGVPAAALGEAQNDFIRFDFDGDGGLEEHECYRLVKEHLKAYRKKIGHVHTGKDMPTKTVAQAGLTLGKELGHGAFGKVYLAKDGSGETRCVKKMEKSNFQGAGLEEL